MVNFADFSTSHNGRHEDFLASCLSKASAGARWQDESGFGPLPRCIAIDERAFVTYNSNDDSVVHYVLERDTHPRTLAPI